MRDGVTQVTAQTMGFSCLHLNDDGVVITHTKLFASCENGCVVVGGCLGDGRNRGIGRSAEAGIWVGNIGRRSLRCIADGVVDMSGGQKRTVSAEAWIISSDGLGIVVQISSCCSHVPDIQGEVLCHFVLESKIEILGVSKMQCLRADIHDVIVGAHTGLFNGAIQRNCLPGVSLIPIECGGARNAIRYDVGASPELSLICREPRTITGSQGAERNIVQAVSGACDQLFGDLVCETGMRPELTEAVAGFKCRTGVAREGPSAWVLSPQRVLGLKVEVGPVTILLMAGKSEVPIQAEVYGQSRVDLKLILAKKR